MERDQASKFVNDLLRLMVSRNGSDLFPDRRFPARHQGGRQDHQSQPAAADGAAHAGLTRAVMNDKQGAEFERTKECNFRHFAAGRGPLPC